MLGRPAEKARSGELAAPLEMSLWAASKHIQVLEKAGLLHRRIEGRRHICRLSDEPLKPAAEWLRCRSTGSQASTPSKPWSNLSERSTHEQHNALNTGSTHHPPIRGFARAALPCLARPRDRRTGGWLQVAAKSPTPLSRSAWVAATASPKRVGRKFSEASRASLLELIPNERIVLLWGFLGPERLDAPRYDSQLTITFEPDTDGGTSLSLIHDRLDTLRAALPDVADRPNGLEYGPRQARRSPRRRCPLSQIATAIRVSRCSSATEMPEAHGYTPAVVCRSGSTSEASSIGR